jgi:hypothetical protein
LKPKGIARVSPLLYVVIPRHFVRKPLTAKDLFGIFEVKLPRHQFPKSFPFSVLLRNTVLSWPPFRALGTPAYPRLYFVGQANPASVSAIAQNFQLVLVLAGYQNPADTTSYEVPG